MPIKKNYFNILIFSKQISNMAWDILYVCVEIDQYGHTFFC